MNAKNILAVVDLFSRRVLPVYALMLAGGVTTQAATIQWDGGPWSSGVATNGTDWGTATNWVGDVAPTSTDTIQFTMNTWNGGGGGTTTNGSNVITPQQSTYGLQVGQTITGTNIPANSYITSVNTNGTLTISNNATATGSSIAFSVVNASGLVSNPTISMGTNRTVYGLSLSSTNATVVLGSAADVTAGYTLTLTNVTRTGFQSNGMTIPVNVNLVPNGTGKSTWYSGTNANNGSLIVTGAVSSSSSVIFNKAGVVSDTLTLNGANTFTGSVLVDSGTLSLGGTNAYTGSTTASGGTVLVNFNANAAATPLTNIINNSSALVLGGVRGGGTVTVNGKNAASTANSQTFASTTLNAGASAFSIVNGISSGTTLVNLGAITRNAGSTVNFVQPTINATIGAANGYTTTTGNDASGILGGYATVGSNLTTPTDWATWNGTNIVAYAGYTDLAGATPDIVNGGNTNVRITSGSTGAVGQASGTVTVNTLRFNDSTARTITVGTGNTLRLGAIGGVLSTGTNGLTIGASGDAGTLTAGGADNTAGELILNNSTALTVNSVIADNGTGAVALTKSGAGTTTLTATSTYTGGTTVNAGTLAVTAGSTDPLATTGAITVTGGTLAPGTGTAQTTTGAVVLAGGTLSGGTLTNNGTALDARNGTISAKLAGSAGINKTTSGTLTLSNTVSNTFTGDTVITEGSVVSTSASNVNTISGNLIVGSASGGNSASFSQTNYTFASAKNVTVYSNGSVNFGGQSQHLAGTVSIIGGSLTGTQLYQDVGFTMTGGTVSGTLYGTTSNYTTLASADTATVSAYLNATNNKTWTVADGAAAVDMLFSGTIAATNASTFNKAGAGLLRFTGTSSATGATTVSGGNLVVTNLADGGMASAVGKSTNIAANLKLGDGTTLQYAGTGHSTDRLFTINGSSAGHSATLEASGTGAANFTNTGSIAYGTTAQTRTLKLGGTSTADNTLASLIADNGTGAVSVTKQDAGKWILTNANTYTGATSITGGTLLVNGSLASGSAVSIGALGALGGSGTIGGTVAVTGAISPGNSPGTLTTGAQTWNAGGTYVWEINDATGAQGTNWDFISSTGTLDITALSSSNKFNVNVISLTVGNVAGEVTNWTDANASWRIASFSSISGTFASDRFNVDTAGFANTTTGVFTITNTNGDIFLTYTAIPEPSTYAAIFGALALVGAAIRRRRRV